MVKSQKTKKKDKKERLPECAGRSIIEIAEEELDAIVDRLMDGGEAEDGRDPGRAEGAAMVIAIFLNPYAPNINAVREQAMERYYHRQGEIPE